MPSCYWCGIWYDDPEIDEMQVGKFLKKVEAGEIKPERDFDCGDKQRHLDIIDEAHKQILNQEVSDIRRGIDLSDN